MLLDCLTQGETEGLWKESCTFNLHEFVMISIVETSEVWFIQYHFAVAAFHGSTSIGAGFLSL